jgi:hypothetical protein
MTHFLNPDSTKCGKEIGAKILAPLKNEAPHRMIVFASDLDVSSAGCNTSGQIARSEGRFSSFHNCTAAVAVFLK